MSNPDEHPERDRMFRIVDAAVEYDQGKQTFTAELRKLGVDMNDDES